MRYYIFKTACDTKETGHVYPQIQKWKLGYDEDHQNSYYSYYEKAKSGNFPDFEPNLDSLVLQSNAKPTDLISSFISTGFIVNLKLKLLFEQFSFPPHRLFPAKILYRNEELDDYYFMHIISDYTNFVDFKKSSFITCGFSRTNPRPITLNSYEDYLTKSAELQHDTFIKKLPYRVINAIEVHLNSDFNTELDFFEIGKFDTNAYISQRLKEALITNRITGYALEQINSNQNQTFVRF